MTNIARIQNAERVRSIRCQSLGNKHGSRALVNLLLPGLGVFDDSEVERRRLLKSSSTSNLPKIDMLDAQTEKKKRTIQVVRRTGYVELEVDDSSSDDEDIISDKKKLPYTEYTAFYFYASGSLKDSYNFMIYDHTHPADNRKSDLFSGSGNDVLGPFELEGISDTQFNERSYSFGKHYLNRGVTNRGLGHVAHIAFKSNGSARKLDSGFWGVWETITASPHFSLEKGGVFRFIETKYVDKEFGGVGLYREFDVRGSTALF